MLAQMMDVSDPPRTPLSLEIPSVKNMGGNENSSSIDIATRRRIQNRNAQRKFRARQRKAKELQGQEQGDEPSQGHKVQERQRQQQQQQKEQREQGLQQISPVEMTGADTTAVPFTCDADWIAQLCAATETLPLTLPELSPTTTIPPLSLEECNKNNKNNSTKPLNKSWEQSPSLLNPQTQRQGSTGNSLNPTAKGITTALHIAVEHEHGNLVQILLAHEPQQYSVQDSRGRTALHIAAQQSLRDILIKLLAMEAEMEVDGLGSDEDSGFGSGPGSGSATSTRTIDLQDADGQTALYIATERGQESMVQELLKFGANPNIGDWSGKRPLHIATLRGDKVLVQLLLEGQADTYFDMH
ncbi:ankyrin repeat-containing domain protein [Aspergillus oleicola]